MSKIKIGDKSYSLVEMSGRQYQTTMDDLEKTFGENWQNKGGLWISGKLIAASLRDSDGNHPGEDAVMDLPISQINKLSQEAMVLNGMTPASRAELEKN